MKITQEKVLPKILNEYFLKNKSGHPLIEGCNYHTTWQSHCAMRFVLDTVSGDNVLLRTRTTAKIFNAKADDLIYIITKHNNDKAKRIISHELSC